jgi:transposase
MPYIPPESKPTKPKRRSFTAEQKKAIAEEALAPGASVSRVARAHDLNTNQVFKWMRECQGKRHSEPIAPTLIPVMLSHTDVAVMPAVVESSIMATGTIELHLPRGRVCLTGTVDPGALRIVLQHLSA